MGECGGEWAGKRVCVFIIAAAIRKKIELNAHTKDEAYLNHIRT